MEEARTKCWATAAKLGVSFWVSGVSSSPLEEIAEAVAAVPDAPAPWYQMCPRPHSLSHPLPLPFVTCYGPAASHGTRLTERGSALFWLCGAKRPDGLPAAARRYNSVRADIAESILQLQRQDLSYQTALQVSARVLQTSLQGFLR